MLWSDLEGKEIVNLRDGEKLGRMSDADLIIDPATGEIHALAVEGGWRLLGGRSVWEIPWSSVRRIGSEVVIVDVDPATVRL
ncbi:MAG: YlmC/YmxH family sporulation protein [Clostridia bacterium]|jgi:YlmC/YmxH family sporulation protein|nr:YlmC/YmxH family sporulation protein [Clostridia bacterium]MCL6521002.1 YlmC/YmxH family sporulation protein [Bacillota bacterium]